MLRGHGGVLESVRILYYSEAAVLMEIGKFLLENTVGKYHEGQHADKKALPSALTVYAEDAEKSTMANSARRSKSAHSQQKAPCRDPCLLLHTVIHKNCGYRRRSLPALDRL